MSAESLQILVEVVNKATGPLDKIQDGLSGLDKISGRLKKSGAAIAGVGAIAVGATAPLVAFGASAIQASKDLNASMAKGWSQKLPMVQ